MKTETMTVHEALAELKILDGRIMKRIHEAEFAVENKKSNKKINGKPVQQYVDDAWKHYQAVNDLITRRQAIRCALSKSNAQTNVTIAGHEYSVAQAIEMKRSGIEMLSALANEMQRQYASAKMECERVNRNVSDTADKQVSAIYGTKEKVTTAQAMSMREAIIESNTMQPVTMIGIEERIRELNDRIDEFTVQVDSKLSVSNALTTITIEY